MDDASNISNVINIINSCITLGRFDFSKLIDILPSISGIGALVRTLAKVPSVKGEILREENNESMTEIVLLDDLRELERRIGNLLEKSKDELMTIKYDTDKTEIKNIINFASIFMKLLSNCLRDPNRKNVELFRQEHQRKSPRDHLSSFLTFIEEDASNPIICAMNQDRFKSKATFQKWSGFIEELMSQFLFLEAFCCGLLCDENIHSVDLLKQEIEAMNFKIERIKNDYQEDNSYWKHVKSLIYDTQDHNAHQGNKAKAEIIQKKLETILTNDSFYVLVYDHCEKSHRHAYRFLNDQAFVSLNRGNCNVAVYRSRHHHNASESDQMQMIKEVESLQKNRIPWSNNYNEILEFIDGIVVHNAGFLAIIRKDRDISIRVVNSETGPGAYTTVKAGHDSQNALYMFFAGFK